jgi:hypothetical protein
MNPDASVGSSPSIASAIEAGRRWVGSLVHYAGDWGWSVLVCAAGLLVLSIIAGATFRFQIVKPIFVTAFAELQKDRAWLNHTKINSK